ncbi:MAG: hypothetical protein ACRDTP_02795, partial [Mycobacteriales bacterium]
MKTTATATLDPNSDAAIIAGVRAWAAALTKSAQTADLTAVRSAATPRCSCLQGAEKSVNYLVAHDLHLTAIYSVTHATVVSRSGSSALVKANVSAGPYEALLSNGNVFKHEPGDSAGSQFSMKLVGSR